MGNKERSLGKCDEVEKRFCWEEVGQLGEISGMESYGQKIEHIF
jgi:hypothetical protein